MLQRCRSSSSTDAPLTEGGQAHLPHTSFFIRRAPHHPLITPDGEFLTPEQVAQMLAMTGSRMAHPTCTSCAVVGGARGLLADGVSGPSIDAHECVMRLNRGLAALERTGQALSSGTKTTHYMFYCCHDHDEQHRLSHARASDWIFLPTTSHGTAWATSALQDKTLGRDSLIIVDPVFVSQLRLAAEILSKPMTGTILVAIALQICTEPLDLFGFDPLRAEYSAPGHDPAQDHRWLSRLADQRLVRIHRR